LRALRSIVDHTNETEIRDIEDLVVSHHAAGQAPTVSTDDLNRFLVESLTEFAIFAISETGAS